MLFPPLSSKLPHTHLHFIGICGSAMSSLALICAKEGYTVSGSDSSPRRNATRLKSAGIPVYEGSSPRHLPTSAVPQDVAVIYSAAIPHNDSELYEAKKRGFKLYERAEFMGLIINGFTNRIGISGMHGKSTVCAMLAEIFIAADADPTVICGADIPSILGAYRIGSGKTVIYEACEYKDSFLRMLPSVAVITNIEPEHLDYFKGIDAIRASFMRFACHADNCIINTDSPEALRLAEALVKENVNPQQSIIKCSSTDSTADYFAQNTALSGGYATFDICGKQFYLKNIRLQIPGVHNVSNALTAAATAATLGISHKQIENGLSEFRGIKRRMEYRGSLNGAVIYDDYAHHPTEIRATLAAAREMGFRFICCAFQPHTYSRTALLFCDFVSAFYDANEVLFADIFAAREENGYGITSRDLATATPNGHYVPTPELIAEHFKRIAAPGVLLLTMGAGELDLVPDLLFSNK